MNETGEGEKSDEKNMEKMFAVYHLRAADRHAAGRTAFGLHGRGRRGKLCKDVKNRFGPFGAASDREDECDKEDLYDEGRDDENHKGDGIKENQLRDI